MSTPTTTAPPPPRPPDDYSKRLYKARIYFAVVAPGTAGFIDRHSYDTSGRYKVTDPHVYGMRVLREFIDKLGSQVSRAIIYDNQAPGRPEVCRKERGSWTN